MSDVLPMGADGRDSRLSAAVIKGLSALRRIDRQSYESLLTLERANVDRQAEAERRTRENQERRALRYLTIEVGLSQDDAREIIRVMAEQHCDPTTAATIIGMRRAVK